MSRTPALRSLTFLLAAALLALPGFAEPAKVVPRHVLDQIVDDDPFPLPRTKTSYELSLPLPEAIRGAAPAGTVTTPAEYDHNAGLLIRWGSFNDVLTSMAVGISTGDDDGIVYIAVSGSSQQASATAVLTGAGADMSQIEFLITPTDSVWMRDYGPRFVSEDGVRTMIDHTYNRPRPNDNNFPDFLAAQWSEPEYDIPLSHGGGNFHLFADGEALMTDLILDENPGLTEAQVEAYYQQYQGLDLTIVDALPQWFDATQHIDMWMFPVRTREVIVNQYTTEPAKTIADDTAALLQSRGYTVRRVDGWNAAGTHYTYTNAVVFNDIVFIPAFDGYPAENAAAVAAFQAAFPGKQIIPVDCTDIIQFAGAIHCIVMHVPEVGAITIFLDNFETGNLSAWSQVLQ